jgi:cell division protein FtsX
MFLLKLALRPLRKSPASQVFSVIALAFLLFSLALLYSVQKDLGPVLNRLKNEQKMTVYLDLNIEAKDEAEVIDSIRTSLGAHSENPADTEINVVKGSQFLDKLRGTFPDLTRELEAMGNEVETVLPRYVTASGVFKDDTLDALKGLHGVEGVESNRDRYGKVVGAFATLKWVIRLLTAGAALTLITALILLSRLNLGLQAEAMTALKLWGAGPFTLRVPGALSGLMVGLTGGLLAAFAWIRLAPGFFHQLHLLSPFLADASSMQGAIAIPLLAAGILCGLVAGFGAKPA